LISADTATGGAGADGGSNGVGAGAGVFLGGGQIITLVASATSPIIFGDSIDDGAGRGGTGVGSLLVQGNGDVTLAAANDFTGGIVLQNAGTLELAGPLSAGTGTITFETNAATLRIDGGTGLANTIAAFQAGDRIDLAGITGATSARIVNGNTLQVLRNAAAPIDLTLSPGQDYSGDTFSTTPDGILTTDAPCFCPGTMILTDRGEVAVEALAVGDRVVTASGAIRPICWIGHRRMDLTRHPAPLRVQPVRVKAGAFAPGKPARDLFLSPEHAVFCEGVLVPVRLLLNGATVTRETARRSVTYYHVELETHDLLLAENLSVESYLDTGNRRMFENAGEPLLLHPDLIDDQARRLAGSCLLFADDPALVEPIWRRLADRAEQLGLALPAQPLTTNDPAMCLIVDGKRYPPLLVKGDRYIFAVAQGATDVRLGSRSAIVCDAAPWVSDERKLGVMLRRMTIRSGADVTDIPLDHPALSDGWWQAEWHGPSTLRRWTDGDAAVPLLTGFCLLEVEVAGTMQYPLRGETLMGQAGQEVCELVATARR
jgi:hypothetical protein